MANTTTTTEGKRAALRGTISSAVSDLVEALQTKPEDSYTSDELTALGVSLTSFDPQDPSYLRSKECLFNPISRKDLYLFLEQSRWGIQESFHESGQDFTDLDGLPYVSSPPVMSETAGQILFLVGKIYRKFFKNNFWGLVNVWGSYSWDQIEDDNSYSIGPMSLSSADHDSLSKWHVQETREWTNDVGFSQIVIEHIMLVICSSVVPQENQLLFSELSSIVQAVENRLDQEEFAQSCLFPVLVLSFCGPRQGRILQANFDQSGALHVRASRLYTFDRMAEYPFDLFMRYYACTPEDIPDLLFYSDREDASVQSSEARQIHLPFRMRQVAA